MDQKPIKKTNIHTKIIKKKRKNQKEKSTVNNKKKKKRNNNNNTNRRIKEKPYYNSSNNDDPQTNSHDVSQPNSHDQHQAAAAKYPYYDISRVGIYGTSAGGQGAAGAVLFHPEFYKAAVVNSGCHDNRMDKASWNEQWMGYPVGPCYSECSNIDNASRLKGKLFLIVGEMDDNVPPESTMRFVDALIKANKDLDLLVVPGAGHGMVGAYGQRRMQDFLLRNLRGVEPPDRNGT